MKICPQCPMHDERYVPSDQIDKRTISELKLQIERMNDFIDFLFEHSEHCDHISYRDAWDEFQAWEDKRDNAPQE